MELAVSADCPLAEACASAPVAHLPATLHTLCYGQGCRLKALCRAMLASLPGLSRRLTRAGSWCACLHKPCNVQCYCTACCKAPKVSNAALPAPVLHSKASELQWLLSLGCHSGHTPARNSRCWTAAERCCWLASGSSRIEYSHACAVYFAAAQDLQSYTVFRDS